MPQIKCLVVRDSQFGVGIVPYHHLTWYESNTNYVVSDNLGHDLIAHVPGDTGTFIQELNALGREMWVSRLYSRSMFPPHSLVVDELVVHLLLYYRKFGELPVLYRSEVPTFDRDGIDRMLAQVRPSVIASSIQKAQLNISDTRLSNENPPFALIHPWLVENLSAIFSHLVYGYWSAGHVDYADHDPIAVSRARRGIAMLSFWNLPSYVGSDVFIEYSFNTGSVKVVDTNGESLYA